MGPHCGAATHDGVVILAAKCVTTALCYECRVKHFEDYAVGESFEHGFPVK